MVYSYIAVAIGAILGALCRFILFNIFNYVACPIHIGILLSNWIGCYSAGLIIPILKHLDPHIYLFLITGFLGSLTTFSAFSIEFWTLLLSKNYFNMLLSITGHVLGSLFMTGLGIATMRFVNFHTL